MILNRQRTVRLVLPGLELFLSRVRLALGLQHHEVTVCFVSDAEIARMNEAFRKKKGPTDVLSFPAIERTRPGRLRQSQKKAQSSSRGPRRKGSRAITEYLGDIAISPAIARRNASCHGRVVHDELRILILHGVLHLLGYDHESDHGQMNRLEQRLRRRFGLA